MTHPPVLHLPPPTPPLSQNASPPVGKASPEGWRAFEKEPPTARDVPNIVRERHAPSSPCPGVWVLREWVLRDWGFERLRVVVCFLWYVVWVLGVWGLEFNFWGGVAF